DRHGHRLNVPAARLGTSDATPAEFTEWLRARDADPEREPFATRSAYGAFLEAQLASAAEASRAVGGVLECRSDRVDDITHAGALEAVRLADASIVHADAVVLAIGPPTAVADPVLLPDSAQSFASPWERGALDAPSPGSSILLRGAGLTAIDAALALLGAEPDLHVTLVSRSGELPRAHAAGDHTPMTWAEEPAWLADRSSLTWDVVRRAAIELARAHVAGGGDERDLVDAVRPRVASLWQRLGAEEQRRFLERDLRTWDVRRHRMAPVVATRLTELLDAGSIVPVTGHVAHVRQVEGGYEVELRGAADQLLVVQRIIDCTGFGRTDRRQHGSLLDTLVAHGRAVPDAHGLGVRSDEFARVTDANGQVQERLVVIGALRRGEVWESTAIPEIRTQAERLAEDLLEVVGIAPTGA
ncbi:MAG: FAD-dependent pyridine nucleotide-disulfide oxidoreductase, partial [Thermoleophilia bacterium]|nr:FAD-dependent pyridine nucleotide-disulfide oxidoreductase [Thermoleophilia bacterium]